MLAHPLQSMNSKHHAQVQTKVMNNYMGIGVDAKVSLEFDRLRTKFPQWFKSQMGESLLAAEHSGLSTASTDP